MRHPQERRGPREASRRGIPASAGWRPGRWAGGIHDQTCAQFLSRRHWAKSRRPCGPRAAAVRIASCAVEARPSVARWTMMRPSCEPLVEAALGDGTEGAPEAAPYDAVLVSAAFPEVPGPLIDQ